MKWLNTKFYILINLILEVIGLKLNLKKTILIELITKFFNDQF